MHEESISRARARRTEYLRSTPTPPGLPLIANTALEVCSIETQRKHPELFHYTKREAFENIVKSNAFWASHYKAMADKNEVVLLRHPLIDALAPRYDALVSSLNRHTRRLYKKGGSGKGVARDLVNALYKSTFENEGGFTALDAFVTSFSTHLTIHHSSARTDWTLNGRNMQARTDSAWSSTRRHLLNFLGRKWTLGTGFT
jgi:hypothetical protein